MTRPTSPYRVPWDGTRWLLAILTTYRLARLLSQEDGPLFAFHRLRLFTDRRRVLEQQRGVEDGPWASLDEGIRCPYCIGVWAALVCYLLVKRPSGIGDFVLSWLGLAGAHALLQGAYDE